MVELGKLALSGAVEVKVFPFAPLRPWAVSQSWSGSTGQPALGGGSRNRKGVIYLASSFMVKCPHYLRGPFSLLGDH